MNEKDSFIVTSKKSPNYGLIIKPTTIIDQNGKVLFDKYKQGETK